MAEGFFATLKTEFYYRRIWPTGPARSATSPRGSRTATNAAGVLLGSQECCGKLRKATRRAGLRHIPGGVVHVVNSCAQELNFGGGYARFSCFSSLGREVLDGPG